MPTKNLKNKRTGVVYMNVTEEAQAKLNMRKYEEVKGKPETKIANKADVKSMVAKAKKAEKDGDFKGAHELYVQVYAIKKTKLTEDKINELAKKIAESEEDKD